MDPKVFRVETCDLADLETLRNRLHGEGYDVQKMERIKDPTGISYILHCNLNLERYRDPNQRQIEFSKERTGR